MKTRMLLSLIAVALFQVGCMTPQKIVRDLQNIPGRKAMPEFDAISDGTMPVRVGQAPEFSSGNIRAIAVIVISPDAHQRQAYYLGPSPLLPPNRKSMIETAIDQELLTKGYRVAARSDIDSLLMEIGFQNSGAVQRRGDLLASDKGVAQLGRMLKVDAVAVIRVNQADAQDATIRWRGHQVPLGKVLNLDMAMRLVLVEAGEALWVASQNISGPFKRLPSLDAACAASARAMVSKLPQRGVAAQLRTPTRAPTLREIVGASSD